MRPLTIAFAFIFLPSISVAQTATVEFSEYARRIAPDTTRQFVHRCSFGQPADATVTFDDSAVQSGTIEQVETEPQHVHAENSVTINFRRVGGSAATGAEPRITVRLTVLCADWESPIRNAATSPAALDALTGTDLCPLSSHAVSLGFELTQFLIGPSIQGTHFVTCRFAADQIGTERQVPFQVTCPAGTLLLQDGYSFSTRSPADRPFVARASSQVLNDARSSWQSFDFNGSVNVPIIQLNAHCEPNS